MKSAPFHPQEEERLKELFRYEVLDTEAEELFDDLTQLASAICQTEISLISLIDDKRQWFKSSVGLPDKETPREVAFCAHAILEEGIFEVPDAHQDERFADNPLVTDYPKLRSYAGAPLVTPSGMPIGTLCVIDKKPHKLTEHQKTALSLLAKQVISQLELRLHNKQLKDVQEEQERFFAVIAHDLKSPFNGILGYSKLLHERSDSLSPEKLGKMAKGILESSMRAYNLLDEMLQWSCNRFGAFKLKYAEINLCTVLEDVTEFLSEALALKQLKVVIHANKNLSFRSDPVLLRTIVRNLVVNAIKYSPEGGEVHLSGSKDKDEMTITVEDQGPGVPQALKHKLFETSVVSEQGSAGEQGMGIGLSLCQSFANQLGGFLDLADSAEGACFVLKLPDHSQN